MLSEAKSASGGAKKTLIIFIAAAVILLIGLGIGGYYTFKYLGSQNGGEEPFEPPENGQPKTQKDYPYTLVAYTGQVFGAKVPQGWDITDTESGIDIVDSSDPNTGVSGAVAIGWFGSQTPDGFIDFMLEAIGATSVNYESESDQEEITDPTSGLKWVMKTKIFTFTDQSGQLIRAKASAGVLNGYGQFCGMITAFQTTPEKWDLWAPTLERIAKSIMIINPSKAGGIDKVRLPTAADLANDSSPLMESWEYRNRVGDWSSHEWSDAMMGQESDLYSPSTGQSYTRPLNDYDPTVGGYRNPDNSSEILVDPYDR